MRSAAVSTLLCEGRFVRDSWQTPSKNKKKERGVDWTHVGRAGAALNIWGEKKRGHVHRLRVMVSYHWLYFFKGFVCFVFIFYEYRCFDRMHGSAACVCYALRGQKRAEDPRDEIQRYQ